MRLNRNSVTEAYGQMKPRKELLESLMNIPADLEGRKGRRMRLGWKIVLGAAMVFLVVFMAGYQNAHVAHALQNIPFLGKMFHLYATVEEKVPIKKAGKPQSEPSESKKSEDIQLYDTQELGDILQVEYITSKKYLEELRPGFYSYSYHGNTEYYERRADKFVKLESQSRKERISVLGRKGTLHYHVVSYHHKQWIQPVEESRSPFRLTSQVVDNAADTINAELGERIWVWLSADEGVREYDYPVLYDRRKRKAVDVLAGVKVAGVKLSRCKQLSRWLLLDDNRMLVSVAVKNNEQARMYLIDCKRKSAISIQSQTGLSRVVSGKKIGNQCFLMELCDTASREEEYYNYYRYDSESGGITPLYEKIKIWADGEKYTGGTRVMFSGGRYDFLQNSSGIYLLDEWTGKSVSVEGLTQEMAAGMLPAEGSAEYIFCCCRAQDTWSQMGVIDLKGRRFYKIRRETAPGISEYAASQSGNHVDIFGEDEEKGAYYYFRYLPK